MKFRTLFPVLFIFLFVLSFKINAQWTACQGLDGMFVTDIKIFDSVTQVSQVPNI